MTAVTATGALIAQATTERTRRRRSEARAKLAGLAVGYLRVSTEEQAVSGLGLEAQRAEVGALAERRGLQIVDWFVDAGVSGATIRKRPEFLRLLIALDEGKAGVLLAKDATRLSRSLNDLGALLSASTQDGWAVVTADGLVDTDDPQGQLLPMFLGIVGELERTFTQQRTRAALAAAKARGVKLGKTSTLPTEVRQGNVTERQAGVTWQRIADDLNLAGVPTGQGGARWYSSTVRAVALSQAPA